MLDWLPPGAGARGLAAEAGDRAERARVVAAFGDAHVRRVRRRQVPAVDLAAEGHRRRANEHLGRRRRGFVLRADELEDLRRQIGVALEADDRVDLEPDRLPSDEDPSDGA